jgi:hypothetical protein
MPIAPRRLLAASLILAAGLLLPACGGGSNTQLTGDHVADLKNTKYRWQLRGEALDLMWEESEGNPEARARTRDVLKEMAWDAEHVPTELRIKIMGKLLTDKDEKNLADSRAMTRLMVPKEPSRGLLVYLGSVIGARGWTDFTGPLIRSYSRYQPLVPDDQRSERGALLTLYPDQKIEKIVYDNFIRPPEMDAIPGVDTTQRLRVEAWDLLGRLDPSGSFRIRALAETGIPQDDALLNAIHRCARELRAIPIAGDELSWLLSLNDTTNEANVAWWAEATSAVSRLSEEQTTALALRNIEAIRWASLNKPDYLTSSRIALLSQLRSRIDSRTTHRRSSDQQSNRKPLRQDLDTWQAKLTWGDVVTILVVDDSLQDPKVQAQLFQQQTLDHQDKQTEYGGVIDYASPGTHTTWEGEEKLVSASWRARLYPPRSSQRFADDRFIASTDMMTAAERALAIYHFHTQRLRNGDYAGPSDGDLEFAAYCGRTCVVFTSIRDGTLNADYYHTGVVIDLGDIERR